MFRWKEVIIKLKNAEYNTCVLLDDILYMCPCKRAAACICACFLFPVLYRSLWLFCPLGFPLDMLRCESLLGLDQATCSRVLNKNYKLLVSMAPLSNEIRPISSCTPQVHTSGGRDNMACWSVRSVFTHFIGVFVSLPLRVCFVCPFYSCTLLWFV